MAGDWIKMRTNLDSDPRIVVIAGMLSLTELHVVGCLWKLWAWADEHTIDGNDIRVTEATLDRFTGVSGFAAALRCVGWLDGVDHSLSFPRFEEHNGQTAKNRSLTAKRVAKHRKNESANRNSGVTTVALPREEKKREEKKEKPNELISTFHSDKEFSELWETFKDVSQSEHYWSIGGAQEQHALAELERDCKTLDVAKEILRKSIAKGRKHPIPLSEIKSKVASKGSNAGFVPGVKLCNP